jgi:hypothetical protein
MPLDTPASPPETTEARQTEAGQTEVGQTEAGHATAGVRARLRRAA